MQCHQSSVISHQSSVIRHQSFAISRHPPSTHPSQTPVNGVCNMWVWGCGDEMRHECSAISHQSSVISHQSSVISHQSSVTINSHQSSVIRHHQSSSVISHQPSAISHQPSAMRHQSSDGPEEVRIMGVRIMHAFLMKCTNRNVGDRSNVHRLRTNIIM